MKTIQDVAKAVSGMARLFDKPVEAETIAFYAEVLLGRLTADEACAAIGQWAASQTRWPSPAHIIELVRPKVEPKDIAGNLSQDLMRGIARYGYTWESTYRYDGFSSIDEAIECEFGLEGLGVVNRCGGWAQFCREWGGEQGNTAGRAQLRNLCEASVKAVSAGENIKAIGSRSKDQIGDFIAHQKALRARNEVPE